MPPRRTIRKPTRWSPEEWAQIEQAAADCGVPPLRYVREAALGSPPTRRPARGRSKDAHRAHDVVNQLVRVLSNLRQLLRVAEANDDRRSARELNWQIKRVEDGIAAAPSVLSADKEQAVAALIEAGVALNTAAHQANASEELPPPSELSWLLIEVDEALRRLLK